MNERNQELIIDLIDGRLSPDEERVAMTRIENDPALHAEYETQMSAISMLGASSTPSMTPAERSTLHTSLRRQLRLDDAPVPVAAAPSRLQRWWAPLGGLAVAAAVVLGAVVVLPGTLSGSDSRETIAMDSAEVETTVPITSLTDDFAGKTDEQNADAGGAEAGATDAETPVPESADAGGISSDEEIQPTTTAESYDVVAEPPIDLPYVSDVDLVALEDELASNPDALNSRQMTPPTEPSELDASRVEACLDTLWSDDSSSSLFPLATTTYEGTAAVVVSVSPSEGDPFLAVFALDSCRELASTRG